MVSSARCTWSNPGACRESEFCVLPQATMKALPQPLMSIAGWVLVGMRAFKAALHEASGVLCSQDLTFGLVFTC